MPVDTTRPYIKSTNPVANASGIDIDSYLSIEFSERMNAATINSTNIGLYKDPIEPVNTTLTYNATFNVLTIKPNDDLEINTRYAFVVSGVVQDYAGNPMGMDVWTNFWSGMPSGYVYEPEDQEQPVAVVLDDYLEVIKTVPENYTTNYQLINDTMQIKIQLNSNCAIGNRNYIGGTGSYSAALGEAYFEDPELSMSDFITIDNQEVLGDPSVDHTPPICNISVQNDLIVIDASGILANNEYIVTVRQGLPSLTMHPLQDDYKFVFTSMYSPLYVGYNVVRLNVGPLLQMMSYIPNDTINRFIYESSRQADRLYPYPIDEGDVPWFVAEFVTYQTKLNAIFSAIMLFAASGAGVKKTLGDLTIDIDAAGLMPLLKPIIDEYTKLRDKYYLILLNGDVGGIGPEWTVKGQFDSLRPSNTRSRMPFKGTPQSNSISDVSNGWMYTYQLIGSYQELPSGEAYTTSILVGN